MNIYREFFEELKYIISALGIEKNENLQSCSDTEIEHIEEQYFPLPLAYKEYLQTIGRKFMFSFFDAEQFSYEDYEDIQEFASETIEELQFKPFKKLLPIAHRRYDYLRFIYEGDKENPDVWFLVPYPDKDEENPSLSELNFIETFVSYLQSSLHYHTASFYFVNEKQEKKNPNIIRDRFIMWQKALIAVKAHTGSFKTENKYIIALHNGFLQYYNANKDFVQQDIKKTWQEEEEKERAEEAETVRQAASYNKIEATTQKTGFFKRLINFLKDNFPAAPFV